MKIRRRTYHELKDDASTVKALALFCFLKRIFPSSVITNYTKDKIHKTTNLHPNTIAKRIKTLSNLGFVSLENDKNGCQRLVLNKIASHHNDRNLDLDVLVYDSIKTVEKSLLALFIVEVQRRKEYAKQVIYKAHHSFDINEVKKMQRAEKCFRSFGKGFTDFGLSYKTIAKRLKISIQKAVNIVKFAVGYDFIVKIKQQLQTFCKDAYRRFEVEEEMANMNNLPTWKRNFTFSTKNNLYKILANRYEFGSRVINNSVV